MRTLLTALFFVLILPAAPAFAAPSCPSPGQDYPLFYTDPALFTDAIAEVAGETPSQTKLSGIIVPHHLLVANLVAKGFRAASGASYSRVVILSPDHYRKTTKPFATTTHGFETPLGPVRVDQPAVDVLLANAGLVEDSCLFASEHGVQAMLPFVRHYFPNAAVVPVAIAIGSGRADWDRLAEALKPLLDDDTLIVQSTDFSHYLSQHEARGFDQQTLNVIAAGSLDAIPALRQPQHLDSVGALYVQMKLQRERYGAAPVIVANENSQITSDRYAAETTSYMVGLFGHFTPGANSPATASDDVTYLVGDVNFGRAMKMTLLDPEAAERVRNAILAITGGRPLVVNLEGVILPNVPDAIDNMTLAMPEDLTLSWLKALNVRAVGLANNHALDLGRSGYAETLATLKSAGIPSFGQGERLALPGFDIVGLSDIDTNGSPQTDLITPDLLDRLSAGEGSRPVVAFVHWGREYVTKPSPRETALADAMRLNAATLIVGGHPHVTSGKLEALGGGDTLMLYSLGNFLFDQTAERSSGAVLEVRAFPQGTLFSRLIPIPNFFDMARIRD